MWRMDDEDIHLVETREIDLHGSPVKIGEKIEKF